LTALVHTGEALATSHDTEGAHRLWRGEAGEALADWVSDLLAAAMDFPALKAREAGETLFVLMQGIVVRSRFGDHPRLAILGPLEARLYQADIVLLGGLNEGGWPSPPPPDPWLSRPMRRNFGLPDAEERVGQSAHDFFLLAASPQVMLCRSSRAGGTPTVASRWLRRLDMVLQAIDGTMPYTAGEEWLALARSLDQPEQYQPRKDRNRARHWHSAPTASRSLRLKNCAPIPTAFYARHILGLRPLDDLEPDIGAADRGTFIHDVLRCFILLHLNSLPSDALALKELLQLGEEKLVEHGLVSERAYWWPRFVRIAEWFIAHERTQRDHTAPVAVEVKGSLVITDAFTLTAQADRIDRTRDGKLLIIDYKTGTLPTARMRSNGFSVQLPLEAAIAWAGGFKKVEAAEISGMEFWHISGGHPAGAATPFDAKQDPGETATNAVDRLRDLVDHFAREESAYLPVPNSDLPLSYNNYLHLSRFKEWADEEEAS
jgi:ATP-dependent helicase/nuclease subunit B